MSGRSIKFIFLVAIAISMGCASVPIHIKNAQVKVRQFNPPANKAYIYVVRPSKFYGGGMPLTIKLDNQSKRLIGNGSFMFFEVEPQKQHTLTLLVGFSGETPLSSIELNCLAGKSYYIMASITKIDVGLLSDEEGKKYVNDLDMSEQSDIPTGL